MNKYCHSTVKEKYKEGDHTQLSGARTASMHYILI